ncbi:glycosyltransferase family 2 protein [Priestia megaterium]|uniref:glycosyltransferase family 2 protein n=1 Tax=Priestia megaterium TaxID=1404 RepID=UPI00189E1054|nr:glycosyltransferase [Priestia megaterium]
MNEPLVTVIIPVYNVEEYLNECIESVLNQSYKNIEIIVINDGSTDKSLGIIEDYKEKNANIIVISQENSGQSFSRNIGIDLAKGDYVFFLDSDDYILPDTLSILIRKLEKNNLDLIRFAAQPFTDNGVTYIGPEYNLKEYFDEHKIYSKNEHLSCCIKAFAATPCLYVVKREILIKNNIRFKNGIIHEDELFTLEVFVNANDIMYDSTQFYKRRYRNNSIMTSISQKKVRYSFDSYCVVINSMDELLKNSDYEKNEIRIIKHRMLITFRVLISLDIPIKYKYKALKNINGISLTTKFIELILAQKKKFIKKIFIKIGLWNAISQFRRV